MLKLIVLGLFLVKLITCFDSLSDNVIFAVNSGGDAFTDSFGIKYRKDFLTEGTASDYGKMISLKRFSNPHDKPLYETERYSMDTFGYSIPMPSNDGDYVLWLKFCEVWFAARAQKVFDVAINDHIVIQELDIFSKVGRGVAHDEIIPFQIRNRKLIINGKSKGFNNEIRVEFLKGIHDNPKINAIILLKGKADQIPPLPQIEMETPQTEDIDTEEYDEEIETPAPSEESYEAVHKKIDSEETIAEDPYASDDNYLIPILATIGAFIPILFCLCKL